MRTHHAIFCFLYSSTKIKIVYYVTKLTIPLLSVTVSIYKYHVQYTNQKSTMHCSAYMDHYEDISNISKKRS